MNLTKGEARARRRFVRTTRQCRRGNPKALLPGALTKDERAQVEAFEARMMLEFELMLEGR